MVAEVADIDDQTREEPTWGGRELATAKIIYIEGKGCDPLPLDAGKEPGKR